MTRTWEGCFSFLKLSLTSMGLRGGRSEDGAGMIQSGTAGARTQELST